MSRSSLAGFEEGSCGASRYPHGPIYRTEDAVAPPVCRTLVSDGRFTGEATAAEKAALASKLKRVVYRESAELRAWAAEVVRRKHRGRPSGLRHLKPEIVRLRAEGLSWRALGKRLGVNPEAARAVVAKRGNKEATC